MNQSSGPHSRRQLNLIAGGPLLDLIWAQLTSEQTGVKQLPQHGQAFFIPTAQRLHITAFQALAVQLIFQPVQHLRQFRRVDGLQDIF